MTKGKTHIHSATCGCGHDHGAARTMLPEATDGPASLVQPALVHAVFGGSLRRRQLLKALGMAGAVALLKDVLPIASLEAMAAEPKPIEKKEVTLGFLPITCSAPLLMADQLGFFKSAGLDVEMVRTPSWAAVRDRLGKGEYDASHVLSPMPLAMTLGLGSAATPISLALIQNTNGQAITLAMKHQQARSPAQWKGFKFGVPFEHSMHNYLLRYYVAEHGVDPDKDIQIIAVPPPEMVAQLKAGAIDGFLSPDPFNQLAVAQGAGFIHTLTAAIWNGHPCCGFAVTPALVKEAPNTYLALAGAVARGALHAQSAANRKDVASRVSGPKYINQPLEVLEAIFTGTFANGLGETVTNPQRIEFDPMPYHSMAVWILTQMKRWGMVGGDVGYAKIAEQVFRAADVSGLITEAGGTVKGGLMPGYQIMGKAFDPQKPDDYVKSFAIRKA
jgi:nitrate/nitrite transport system substrate-binding protein